MKAWNGPKTIYVTYIVTTAEKLWAALTSAEFTRQYFFGRRIESDWEVGAIVRYWQEDGTLDVEGTILEYDPPRAFPIPGASCGSRNTAISPRRWSPSNSIRSARSCGSP
jgi:hypothetical protein